jgi:hypothetical protein
VHTPLLWSSLFLLQCYTACTTHKLFPHNLLAKLQTIAMQLGLQWQRTKLQCEIHIKLKTINWTYWESLLSVAIINNATPIVLPHGLRPYHEYKTLYVVTEMSNIRHRLHDSGKSMRFTRLNLNKLWQNLKLLLNKGMGK